MTRRDPFTGQRTDVDLPDPSWSCVVGTKEADMCDWGGEFRHTRCLTTWLRDRADSFWRDSVELRAEGDLPMAVAYETLAHQLRICAEEIK